MWKIFFASPDSLKIPSYPDIKWSLWWWWDYHNNRREKRKCIDSWCNVRELVSFTQYTRREKEKTWPTKISFCTPLCVHNRERWFSLLDKWVVGELIYAISFSFFFLTPFNSDFSSHPFSTCVLLLSLQEMRNGKRIGRCSFFTTSRERIISFTIDRITCVYFYCLYPFLSSSYIPHFDFPPTFPFHLVSPLEMLLSLETIVGPLPQIVCFHFKGSLLLLSSVIVSYLSRAKAGSLCLPFENYPETELHTDYLIDWH